MSFIRRIFRRAALLAGAAAAILASAAAILASAAAVPAFAKIAPPLGGSGGTEVTPTPVIRTVTVGGTPGWQIALLMAGAAVLAAAAAVLLDRLRAARRAQLAQPAQ
jgi:cell division protein FtsX